MKNNLFELKVWSKSIELSEKVYKITEHFPDKEKFGLISQMRRCAVSTASNIAEGAGRNTKGEFRQFLGIANGSRYELLTQLIISNRLGFITEVTKEDLIKDIDEVQRMIHGLQKNIAA